MAMRYPGGFISSTAPTVSANSAKGVWTLEEAMQYIRAGQWPVATGNGDPFFQSNILLLPGQGTNGAQNNTFLDSSTNNFTITRNGNTTQGTFTPFSGTAGNWSNFFDGNGDFLLGPNNAAFDFASGDVTLEAWVYLNAISSQAFVSCFPTGGTGFTGWSFTVNASGFLLMDVWVTGTEQYITATSNQIPANQWTHVAYTRASGTSRLFVNGVSCSFSGSISQAINAGGNPVSVGAARYAGFEAFVNGYISNCRVVKGTAVYTSAFTPPTAPLTAITNTSLLTCQSNRFVDNSTNAFTLTANGNVAVTPFQPFGAPTVAYSASTIGGSGYFDGSGDYLNVASNSAFAFGTGDFTFETFAYYNALTPVDAVAMLNWTGLTWSPNYWSLHLNHVSYASKVTFWFHNYSSTVPILTSTTTMTVGQWYHVAVSRSGNTFKLFINGVVEATVTSSASLDGGTNSPIYIGGSLGATQPFNGYLSSLRLVKGTAVYTAAFTPPTAPLTAITNTSLLLSGTNAGIIDNAQDNNLETVGGAQISTTQYKWGASSMYFDGTSDYLTMINQGSIFSFGTGDFTVEAWVYLNAMPSGNGYPASYWIVGGGPVSGTLGFDIAIGSTNLQVGISTFASLNINAAHGMTTSTWYHVAVVRAGSTLKAFINGNTLATASVSGVTADPCLTGLAVSAAEPVGSTGGNFNGYIQDLRITKGYARYPYSFTPPTAALPLFWQAAATPSSDPYFDYTTLLLPGNGTNGAQNNTFLDSSTNAFTITRNGNTTQGTFTPFSQTGWGNFFSGTTDNLEFASNAAFAIGTGNFTVEFFLNSSDWSGNQRFFQIGQSGTDGIAIGRPNSNDLAIDIANTRIITYAWTPQVGIWNHVAVVRSGSAVTLYINGVVVATGTSSGSVGQNAAFIGGIDWASSYNARGFISNFRFSNNARTITVPTTPYTSDANTVLLSCQSNRFVDNSSNAFAVILNGTPTVQAFSPFNPTASYSAATVGGSGYFDGTGDYLSVANNALIATGDFTMEAWCYTTRNNAYQGIISSGDSSNTAGARIVQGNTGNVEFWVNGQANTSTALPINQWNHVAIVRSGSGSNNISCYLNGTRLGQLTQTSSTTNNTVVVGRYYNNGTDQYHWLGYIADARFVVGSAVYSGATYTVPTAPLTAVTNTQLLLSGTNGGIIDNTAKNNLETVGGASISTTVSKFGGSSMYFDGTGDWLDILAANQLSNFSSGDWTIEAWIYRSTASANHCLLNFINSAGANAGLTLQVNSSNQLVTDNGTAGALAAGTVPSNQWVHIAIARYSGTTTGYINGVAVGTTTQAPSASQYLRIGALGNGAYTYHGYINDLRVTKGIARYTQNFTPPTTAFLTL
jgi:hypothetical protein